MTISSASQWSRESLKKAGSLKMESPQADVFGYVIRSKLLGVQICVIWSN
jgi:hypothetical protein